LGGPKVQTAIHQAAIEKVVVLLSYIVRVVVEGIFMLSFNLVFDFRLTRFGLPKQRRFP